jgi:competence protein ComEA
MIFLFPSFIQKYKKKLLLPTTVIVVILFFFLQTQFKTSEPTADAIQPIPIHETIIEQEEITEPIEDISLFVEVKGAVIHPGVYELTQGDRVLKAIELAGGYLPTSDSKGINHAQKVADEMVVYVPLEGEVIVEQASTLTPTESTGLVNINQADANLLMTLPGIGPAKADAIIAHREGQGLFKDPADLKNVTGIGQKTFEKLEVLISVK